MGCLLGNLLSKTALNVDDSKSARVVLKRMLEAYELDVDTTESAESTLDYLKAHRPDVIFMDHLMPGTDGFEARDRDQEQSGYFDDSRPKSQFKKTASR